MTSSKTIKIYIQLNGRRVPLLNLLIPWALNNSYELCRSLVRLISFVNIPVLDGALGAITILFEAVRSF